MTGQVAWRAAANEARPSGQHEAPFSGGRIADDALELRGTVVVLYEG